MKDNIAIYGFDIGHSLNITEFVYGPVATGTGPQFVYDTNTMC